MEPSVPLIPRRILFGNPESTLPQIAPNAQLLAYIAPLDGVMNVWCLPIPGAQSPRPITKETKRPIRQFFWRYDSHAVLYLQDQDGDENFHLFQTECSTGHTVDLTPFPNTRSQQVLLMPSKPMEALITINKRDPRLFDVYRINLETGHIALDTSNPGDVTEWVADNFLQVRAAIALLPNGDVEVRYRENPEAPWHTVLRWGPEEIPGYAVGFASDNRTLLVTTSLNANALRLLAIDPHEGTQQVVAEDPQYDVSSVLRHPRTHSVQAVQFIRARREWLILDGGLQHDFHTLQRVQEGDILILSRDQRDLLWTVAYLRDNGPLDYFLYHREARKATHLFNSQSQLHNYTLARMEPVSFPARDGLPLYAYLTLPPGLEPKNLPLVLLVHGGPWGRDTWEFDPEAQLLANRGYAVLQINYRGSAGYGKQHLNAGNREWGQKMHTDLLDGKRWAIEKGYANPNRVAIMGTSYGGYATLVGLAFSPDEFICGVDVVGPSNLLTLLQSIPPYWAPLRALFLHRIGDPEKEPEFLKSRSPLYKADQIKAPLLIAQGSNDPRVKRSESDQIVQALRAQGKTVEYLLFPDEGHGLARPENRLKLIAAVERFLATHLGGRAEPPSPEENADSLYA